VAKAEGLVGEVYGTTGVGGEGSGGARVCTYSATSVTEEVRCACLAPPSEVHRRMGT
jgi:hypothetical protein